MILFENVSRTLQVERLLGPVAPRQLRHGLEIGADHLRLHRFTAGTLQACQLAVDFFARGLRQIERVEPLLQIVGLGRLSFFPELFADGLHLLAQQHFALPLAELFLDL